MDISSLIVSEKVVKAEYPDPAFEGFTVELCYLARAEIQKIRTKCISMVYSKKTHKPEEKLDDDLFLKLYVSKVIKGWEGLTAGYLADLMPIDISAIDVNTAIDFTEANALSLMQNSVEFDSWVSGVVSDLALFNKNSLSKKEKTS